MSKKQQRKLAKEEKKRLKILKKVRGAAAKTIPKQRGTSEAEVGACTPLPVG